MVQRVVTFVGDAGQSYHAKPLDSSLVVSPWADDAVAFDLLGNTTSIFEASLDDAYSWLIFAGTPASPVGQPNSPVGQVDSVSAVNASGIYDYFTDADRAEAFKYLPAVGDSVVEAQNFIGLSGNTFQFVRGDNYESRPISIPVSGIDDGSTLLMVLKDTVRKTSYQFTMSVSGGNAVFAASGSQTRAVPDGSSYPMQIKLQHAEGDLQTIWPADGSTGTAKAKEIAAN